MPESACGWMWQRRQAAHGNHVYGNTVSLSGWTGGHRISMTVAMVIPLVLQCNLTRPRQEGLQTQRECGGQVGKADSSACHCLMTALARFNRACRQPAISVLKLVVECYNCLCCLRAAEIRDLLVWMITAALPLKAQPEMLSPGCSSPKGSRKLAGGQGYRPLAWVRHFQPLCERARTPGVGSHWPAPCPRRPCSETGVGPSPSPAGSELAGDFRCDDCGLQRHQYLFGSNVLLCLLWARIPCPRVHMLWWPSTCILQCA